MSADVKPYEAACQSRFNKPEMICVLGDVVRRLRLLKGTRAAIGRKGFSADLQTLAKATADDFMHAMNIARPRESITTAVTRSDMPAKVKTALRTLLLCTSDVPGTEGRKTALRFDGHGNNLSFGAPTFFTTPNFADTYNYLILHLHEGPGKHSHLNIRSASQTAVSDTPPEITRAEPKMPSGTNASNRCPRPSSTSEVFHAHDRTTLQIHHWCRASPHRAPDAGSAETSSTRPSGSLIAAMHSTRNSRCAGSF